VGKGTLYEENLVRNQFVSLMGQSQIAAVGAKAITGGSMEGLFQPMHLLVIFLIALLIFGPKKLPELGKGFGEAFRSFKDSVKDKPAESSATPSAPAANSQEIKS